MFLKCTSLQVVDLTAIDASKLTQTANMFYLCGNLETIYANDWVRTTGGVDSYMFKDCFKLVGAVAYDASQTGWSMARTATGYFTAKPTE